MGRGRPPLQVGAYGRIAVSGQPEPRKGSKPAYRAKARIRDRDGIVRTVVRYGQTKAAAERTLRGALAERAHVIGGEITDSTRVSDLAALWLEDVRSSDRSARTKEHYAYAVARYVEPALGQLRLAETSTAVCDRTLKTIAAEHGPGSARSARAVLTGMFGTAARLGAVRVNPFRETAPIRSSTPKKPPRALTPAEADTLTDGLRADPRALQMDLPDLVEWMLGTGARIGEACAARETVIDLAAGTWEINATVIRIKGEGLVIQERPKTAAGWRVLALPSFAVGMVERRLAELRLARPGGVVFGAPLAAALRDPSNTAGELRAALDRLGFDWVTSHVFRKTVGTRLDEAGFSAREIADQLGHARPSLTQDVYMGRKVVSARAASVLDR